MNVDEVLGHARQNSKFIRLEDGESITGRFTGNFELKVSKDQAGKPYTKYDGTFELEDGTLKTFSVSAGLIKECKLRSKIKGLTFENTVFTILKKGSGLGTRYLVEVAGGANKANFAQAKAMLKDNDQNDDPEIDGVPF